MTALAQRETDWRASQPGVDWTASLTPAVISALFLLLVIVVRLRARRAAR